MTRGPRLAAALLAAVFSFPAAAAAFTRPGDLDSDFVGTGVGTLGTVQTVVGNSLPPAAGGAAVVQMPSTPDRPGPRLVVGGNATVSGGRTEFALVRYLDDGTLDPSFGTGGEVTIPVGDGDATLATLLLRPDGYIVAAGTALKGGDRVFALALVGPDGTLNTQYGDIANPGITLTPVGAPDSAPRNASVEALIPGPNSGVIAAGWALDGDSDAMALARYDAAGHIDTSFGPAHTGIVLTDPGAEPALRAFALQQDIGGTIYVAGDTGDTGPLALVRYDGNGNLLGETFTSVGDGGSAHARSLLTQTDGKLLVAGYARNLGSDAFALARYTAAGALDPGFGTGGTLVTPIGQSSRASAAALVLNREIIASGDATVGGVQGFALSAYDMSGQPDPGFGSGGMVFTPFVDANGLDADAVSGLGAVVQDDTKLVVAGGLSDRGIGKFALARYITNVAGSSGGGTQGAFGGVGGTQVSGGGGSRRAGILIGRAKMSGHTRALVRLKCVNAAGFCRGRLILRVGRRVGRHHKLRRYSAASVKFEVKSGRTGTLKLRLNARTRHLLGTHHELRVTASARAKDANGRTYRDFTSLVLRLRPKH